MSNAAYDVVKESLREPLLFADRKGTYDKPCSFSFPREWVEKNQEYAFEADPDNSNRLVLNASKEKMHRVIRELERELSSFKDCRLKNTPQYALLAQDMRWRVVNILNAFFQPEKTAIDSELGEGWAQASVSSNDHPQLLEALIVKTWGKLEDQRYLFCDVGPFFTVHNQRTRANYQRDHQKEDLPTINAHSSPPAKKMASDECNRISLEILNFFTDQSLCFSESQLRPQHPAEFYRVLAERPEARDPTALICSHPDSHDPRLKWLFIQATDIAYDILMREFRDPIVRASQKWLSARKRAFATAKTGTVVKMQNAPACKKIFDRRDLPDEVEQSRFIPDPKNPSNLAFYVPFTTLKVIFDKLMTAAARLKDGKKPGPLIIAEIKKITQLVLKGCFYPELKALEWMQKNSQETNFSDVNAANFFDAFVFQIFQQITQDEDPRIARSLVSSCLKKRDSGNHMLLKQDKRVATCISGKMGLQMGPISTTFWSGRRVRQL